MRLVCWIGGNDIKAASGESNKAGAIDLSLSLFPWAAYRDDTAKVKLSVGLNHGT